MKNMLLMLFVFLTELLEAQVVDTAVVGREVDSLLQVSEELYVKGNYKKMYEVTSMAVEKAEPTFGRYSARVANGLNNAGAAKMSMGDMNAAILFLKEAADIREKLYGSKSAAFAESLINLGVLYLNMGRVVDAEVQMAKLKKIITRESSLYPITLNNLASIFIALGRFAEAEPLLMEAKDILAKTLGREHPDMGYFVNNLGSYYQNTGQFFKAEVFFLEAKSIWEKSLGRGHPKYALVLNNLAGLLQDMGRYQEAEQLFLESKSIREKVFGRDHPEYASSLNNLGLLYASTGRRQDAIPFFNEALKIWETKPGRETPVYASGLNNLAESLSGTRRNDVEAETLYIEVIGIRERVLGKSHFSYAFGLNNLAAIYRRTSREAQADSLYILASNIVAKNKGRETRDYISILTSHSALYQQMGRFEQCEQVLLEADTLNYNILVQAAHFLSEAELYSYASMDRKRTNHLFSHAFQRHLAPGRIPRICYNNTLFFKGFILETASEIRSRAQADTATAERNEKLAGFRRRLSQEYSRPIANRDTSIINYIEPRANALEKDLARMVSGYADAYRIIEWQEVRDRLQPSEAAVEFVNFRYYDQKSKPTDSTLYAALVLLPTDTTPHFIPLFEERQLKAQFNRPGFDEQLTVKSLYGARSELLNLLWQPLESLLRDVKTIYYSPSGLLHRINPAALLDESKQPLSANRQWVRVGSTRELVTGRLADKSFAKMPDGANSALRTPHSAIVYGGITYDMDSLAFTAANPIEATDSGDALDFRRKDGNFRYIVEEQSPGTSSGIRGGDDGAWEPLTGSAREAEQVGALLRNAGFRSELQKDYWASEERIKKIGKNGPSPRILHLATHGFAYPDPKKALPKAFASDEPTYKLQDDPMLRSGLVLAGANHYWINKRPLENREDGVLVAYEVRDMNLRNTELAVLSACQTGLGDVVGSEGVYGLQRAFRIAGAKFLIVSLWQVPDAQTQELMRLFYENWLDKQESLRDAFNHAQQTLREQEPNPYMWAGFVLIE